MTYAITTEHGHHSGGWTLDQAYDLAAALVAAGGFTRVLIRSE